jgi:hypothetical protein
MPIELVKGAGKKGGSAIFGRNIQPDELEQLSQLMKKTGWFWANCYGKFYPSSEYLLGEINRMIQQVDDEEGLDGLSSGGLIVTKTENDSLELTLLL